MISPVLYFVLVFCSVFSNPTDLSILPKTEICSQIVIKPDSDGPVDSTLKSVASFPIGVAFNSSIIKESPAAARLFFNQFDSKTVQAYMNTEPTPGKFNLSEVDYWVSATSGKSIRLHGHCLVYHMALPTWFTQFENTTDFEKSIEQHIKTIVGRYKGKIKSWDVINEIFDYKSGTIRQTPFRKLYNNDSDYMEFVKRCFYWAHEADPRALLFYNDFNLESSNSKLQAVVDMINTFNRSGVPIQGVGTQMHINVTTSDIGIRNAFRRLSSTGLLIHVSELDIAVNPDNDPTLLFTGQIKKVQASKYQTTAILYENNVPPRLQYGITLWSFSDADSWLVTNRKQHDMPNIFDENFTKKPAYYGLFKGLQQ